MGSPLSAGGMDPGPGARQTGRPPPPAPSPLEESRRRTRERSHVRSRWARREWPQPWPKCRARDVVVDVLPCFNQGYKARGVQEVTVALVEEETQQYQPTKNYLSYLPVHDYSIFETELMQNKFEHLEAQQPLELFSMRRYDLPAPSSRQMNDIMTYQECVNSSMAQLEHQAVHIKNVKLMSQYGCNAWTLYKEHLVHRIEHAQEELQKLRKNIQDLNWQRKNMQLTAGAKLREMESAWVSLVSKNHDLERTIVQLENEISQIKQHHGEANKENIQQDFQ
ncbi:pre-mRNA-splicing factor SPF27-like [Geothlypis trichas]